MTAPDDLDRQLDAFLTRRPDRPARPVVRCGPRSHGNDPTAGRHRPVEVARHEQARPVGLGAAAVVAVLVIGSQLLGPRHPAGSVPPHHRPLRRPSSPTPEPSIPASPSPDAALPLGPHALSHSGSVVPMTVTIPAPGWGRLQASDASSRTRTPDPPDGAGMIVYAEDNDWLVHVSGSLFVEHDPAGDTGAATVDELVTALAGQTGRDASAPEDITIGGHDGQSITLHVPDDAVLAACDGGKFCSLAAPELSPSDPCYRYHQGPGQIDTFWIVDVDGVVVVIDSAVYAGTPRVTPPSWKRSSARPSSSSRRPATMVRCAGGPNVAARVLREDRTEDPARIPIRQTRSHEGAGA